MNRVRHRLPKQVRHRPPHFYWNGKLHKVIWISRPANLVEAWCFSERKSVSLLYSDYRTNAKPALSTGAAAKVMRLSPRTLHGYVVDKVIRHPEKSYAMDGNFNSRGKTWWSEKDLMDLHDYRMTVDRVHPRKDGKVFPDSRMPSKAEIRAMLDNSTVLYVKNNEGKFIPLFEQPRW